MAIQTDPANGQIDSALGLFDKVPFGGQVRDQLEQSLDARGVNFEKDVRPLLGNPLVVGTPGAAAPSEFVAAWKTKNADALAKALDGLKKVGERDGASIYEGGGTVYARRGDVVVFAGDRPAVEAALDTRGKDDRFSQEDFDSGTGDVAKDALLRAYFAAGRLVDRSPAAAQARKVPWIAALETAGVAVSAADDRVALDFDLLTGRVAEPDLPLAPTPGAPPVLERSGGQGEVALALRDPAHLAEFFRRAAKSANPSAFARFGKVTQAISRRLGVSFERDVLGQAKGDAQATFTPDGKFALRSDLTDPAALRRKLGGTLHEVTLPGGRSIAFGVVNDELVVSDGHTRAAALATAATRPVPGAKGALAGTADAEGLANDAIARVQQGPLGAIGGSLFTGPLGDITLSLGDDSDDLRGRVVVAID